MFFFMGGEGFWMGFDVFFFNVLLDGVWVFG